jgi:hypothetical protein
MPMVDEQRKKMCYRYIIEYYSATKENEILSSSAKWMELENFFAKSKKPDTEQ